MKPRLCLAVVAITSVLLVPVAATANPLSTARRSGQVVHPDTNTDTDTDNDTDDNWSGSGELGFALSKGNSHTENLNAKLQLQQENDLWKSSFYLSGLRSKGDITVTDPDTGETYTAFETTANRYEGGASVGYKLSPRSYVNTTGRYEHDDFGAKRWQGIISIGYGYIALKTARTELSFEIGPGYKRYRPNYTTVTRNGQSQRVLPPIEDEGVVRGLVNWKWNLTDNTRLEDSLLVEAGNRDRYYQNDLGLSVDMTEKLSLKIAYQLRYNTDIQPGAENTDQLYTTNVVYNF